MRYISAYLLAVLGNKIDPSVTDIEKILSSVGIEADKDSLSKVVTELKGKDIDELMAEGQKKLASMPAGGAAPVPSATPAASSTESGKDKKEEKKKEESEEEDDDMGFGLFD